VVVVVDGGAQQGDLDVDGVERSAARSPDMTAASSTGVLGRGSTGGDAAQGYHTVAGDGASRAPAAQARRPGARSLCAAATASTGRPDCGPTPPDSRRRALGCGTTASPRRGPGSSGVHPRCALGRPATVRSSAALAGGTKGCSAARLRARAGGRQPCTQNRRLSGTAGPLRAALWTTALLSTNRGDHRTPRAQPVAGPAPAPPEARGDRGPQPVRTESARGPSQAGDDQ
jgi:hypothetical protein